MERPILSEAIARVEQGLAAGVIVAQLDRLSRMDIADALATIRRVEDAGGQVIAVAENFDAGTPEGRMARNVLLALGEMQLDRYRAQFAAAKQSAVRRGVWPTRTVPIGYRKTAERTLEPDPATAPLVRRAFEMRASGASWSAIGEVIGRGISGAGRVVANRVYLGELRVGEWVNAASHEALVSREVFEAAQIHHPRPPRHGRPPALLSGLVKCAGCGFAMSADASIYRCFPRKAGGICRAPAIISRRLLDGHVEGIYLEARGEWEPLVASRTNEVDLAAQALEAAEAELEAFQASVRTAEVGVEHFASGMRQRVRAVEDASAELGRARSLRVLPDLPNVAGIWEGLGVEDRRHVLGGFLDRIEITKGRGLDRVRLVRRDEVD